MGNIVSNPGTPLELPTNQPSTGSNPAVPSPPPVPVQSTTPIEGMGEAPPQAGYGVDPFGPMAQSPSSPPDINSPSVPELPSITPDPPAPPPEPPPFSPPETGSSNTQSDVTTLLSKIPDMQQMMKDLEKSGCLLPELNIKQTQHVDTSPLAALQPQRLKDQVYFSSPNAEPIKPILPEVQLATTSAPRPQNQTGEAKELPLYVFTLAICLLQVIQGAAQVAHFALIRYPQYEELVIATAMTTDEVNTTVIKAVFIAVMICVSFLTFLFVLFKRPKNHTPLLYFSVVVIVFNFFVQNVMAGGEFVSGSPLVLPSILSEIISGR